MPADFPNFVENAEHIEVAKDCHYAALFAGLVGRHEFEVRSEDDPDSKRTVILRIDLDNGMISGDQFKVTKARSDDGIRQWTWERSWISEAIYQPTEGHDGAVAWDFAAICTAYVREPERPGSEQKVVLTAKRETRNGTGKLGEFRMALIDGMGWPRDLRCLPVHREGETGYSSFPEFRQVKLSFKGNDVFKREPWREVLERVFLACDGGPPLLHKALSDGKISATGTEFGEIEFVPAEESGKAKNDIFESYLNEVIRQPGEVQECGQKKRPDAPPQERYEYRFFLSAAEDKQGENEIPLGRTLGLNPNRNRLGVRQAAIIFPNEILKSFELQHSGFKLGAGSEHRLDELARRLTFTIMHELAHLLNLPHPWQRAGFKDANMAAEPQAASWTNYGSLFPFGYAAVDYYQRSWDRETKEKKRLKRADKVMEKHLVEPKFTTIEKVHLHHAPHDRIAPGERSFIDADRENLQMEASSTSGDTLTLEIDGQEIIDGRPWVRANHYTKFQHGDKFQPLTGLVRLRIRADKADKADSDFLFRFPQGNLDLMVREEFGADWPANRRRLTKVYSPRFHMIDRRVVRTAPNLCVHKVRSSSATARNEVWHHEYIAPLPLIQPIFFYGGFSRKQVFTLQVVLRTEGQPNIYSNQIRVNYEKNANRQPFGDLTEVVCCLLRNEITPALQDAALYFENTRLASMDEIKNVLDVIKGPGIGELLKVCPDLAWLARTRALLDEREGHNLDYQCSIADRTREHTEQPEEWPEYLNHGSTPELRDCLHEKIQQSIEQERLRKQAELQSENLGGFSDPLQNGSSDADEKPINQGRVP